MDQILKGHFTGDDKAADDYRLLPFNVPPGTRRIEVVHHYDRSSGNVLDLGVFDPRGDQFLAAEGFRGWSGGARDRFVLTETSATPGYLPGPLLAGTWHVILGLYKIAPEGCDFRVAITLSGEPGELPHPRPSPAPQGATRQGPAWFRGDLQSHTFHSDAAGSVSDLALVARREGLDFVSVTDHNTVSHHPDLRALSGPDLLLIPGEEVTTNYGHANVWGLDRWLEFRCRTNDDMARVIEEAHRRGLLFSVNHPKTGGPPWQYSVDLPFDCMEVWQALWPMHNDESLALWDSLLQQGRRVVAVGGSDTHQGPADAPPGPLMLGRPTTWVFADALTPEAILEGIRAGHVFVTGDPSMPRVHLEAHRRGQIAMMGDRLPGTGAAHIGCRVFQGKGTVLRLVGPHGELHVVFIQDDEAHLDWTISLERDGWVRAELRAAPWRVGEPSTDQVMLALTNPVYGSG